MMRRLARLLLLGLALVAAGCAFPAEDAGAARAADEAEERRRAEEARYVGLIVETEVARDRAWRELNATLSAFLEGEGSARAAYLSIQDALEMHRDNRSRLNATVPPPQYRNAHADLVESHDLAIATLEAAEACLGRLDFAACDRAPALGERSVDAHARFADAFPLLPDALREPPALPAGLPDL
jgi:hypothetical protein